MKPKAMLILSGVAICLGSVRFAGAEVLLDHMDLARHQTGLVLGNAIGGDNIFGNGKQVAIQLACDFRTTDLGYVIVQVEVANLVFFEDTRILDGRISLYREAEGRPEEDPVYSKRFSEISSFSPTSAPGIVHSYFDDDYFGLFGVWTTISGLNIVLEANKTYFIAVQVDAGPDDWGYTIRNEEILFGTDSYVRDGPEEEDECRCGWGFTDWRSFEEVGRPPGEAAYRVVATGQAPPMPEPDKVIRSGHPERKPPGNVDQRRRREAGRSGSEFDR